MTKYDLVKKTENNGDVWYHIRKDGMYVDNTYTKDLNTALSQLEEFQNGKPAEPIVQIIKTIEVNEDQAN